MKTKNAAGASSGTPSLKIPWNGCNKNSREERRYLKLQLYIRDNSTTLFYKKSLVNIVVIKLYQTTNLFLVLKITKTLPESFASSSHIQVHTAAKEHVVALTKLKTDHKTIFMTAVVARVPLRIFQDLFATHRIPPDWNV